MQLGLLDARHIAGDLAVTTSLRTTVARRLAQPGPETPSRPAGAVRGKRRTPGRSAVPILEPDLKGGPRRNCGDATALRAVAAYWLADAPPREGLADARPAPRRRDALH
ncbi:hypothetical protein GCM10023238_04230 [Streptomyces heliomycini]